MPLLCCARRKKTSKTWVSNLSSLPRVTVVMVQKNEILRNRMINLHMSFENCNIHDICDILEKLQFYCACTLHKEKDPRENRIRDTMLGCQKCRNNSIETRIFKFVTNMVRHHDQYEREDDGAMHVNIILVLLTERFQIMRDKEFTNEDSLNCFFLGSYKTSF